MESFKSYLMLLEGFKEVKQKWVDEGYSGFAVTDMITQYKDLVKKNQITYPLDDIGYWSDSTFAGFGRMVDDANKKYQSTRALKKTATNKDYPILYENDKCVVYQILSKAASCKLGSDTPWCITNENQNYYEWHVNHGYEIIFIISKSYDEHYWADEEGWKKDNKWALIRNDWKWSLWNKDNKSSFNHGMMGELNEICNILGIDEDTQRELFETSGMEEAPNYDVPNDVYDDGHWEDDYEEQDWEPEEEEVLDTWQDENGYHYGVENIRDEGDFKNIIRNLDYIDQFADEYLEKLIEDNDEVYDGMIKLLGINSDDMPTVPELQAYFEKSPYYETYKNEMYEQMREHIADEMEGEIAVHPHTGDRILFPFIRARLNTFKTYPHVVLPMLEED